MRFEVGSPSTVQIGAAIVCLSELVGGGMDHAPRERATHAIIQTENTNSTPISTISLRCHRDADLRFYIK